MRILVADDHELFLKGLEFILRDNFPGVELVFAHNYPEIFKIIEKETDFNLIMTDLAMPGGRWSEAFEKIHALLPETPIAVLSAVFDKEIVQKTIDIGVSGYIPDYFGRRLYSAGIAGQPAETGICLPAGR